MISHRAFQFRLAPTKEQDATLRRFAAISRYIYNLALEQRRDFWRQYSRTTGRTIGFASQCRELTQLRADAEWIRELPASVATRALQDLDHAFNAFFSGRSRYPSFRAKGLNESFRCRDGVTKVRRINKRWSEVWLPKVGWVRYRDTRPLAGEVRGATVKLTPVGWHVAFTCAADICTPANDNPAVGIDRGIANTVALSTGETFTIPSRLAETERKRRKAARALSRCRNGSARRMKRKESLARISAQRARQREHWLHCLSAKLVRGFGLIALEKLQIGNMTASGRGKRGLNRAILEQGWGRFATMLDYKLAERGGSLVYVNPAYSSQTCSECGAIDSKSRESQARFCCTTCGHAEHADINAAKIILRRSTPAVEGCGCAPGEAETSRMAA